MKPLDLRLITQPLAVRQSFQMSLALEIHDIPPFFKKEMPQKCQRSQFSASQIPKNPPGPLDHPSVPRRGHVWTPLCSPVPG